VVVADSQTVLREHPASLLARSGFDAVGRAGDAPSYFSLLKSEGTFRSGRHTHACDA
jgi:hypothetical protein